MEEEGRRLKGEKGPGWGCSRVPLGTASSLACRLGPRPYRLGALEREWVGGAHLAHHVGGGLPAPGADVLVEGDVEVGGRLIVLDHVEEG